MAVDTIRRLLFTPPIAVARVGGSTTPMDAFSWGPGDPHTITETRVRPDWTLRVDADGSVTPELPGEVRMRDGALIRPVAPFLELWALTGDGDDPAAWQAAPVTPALLAANDVGEANVTFTVTAVNAKAARRAGNAELRFGTFPPVTLTGDDHTRVPLRGESPPGAASAMIPAGRSVPLGAVQVLRPRPPVTDAPWPPEVRLDVLRLRFTPGAGHAYGPPEAAVAQPSAGLPAAVPPDRAFLNPAAGWFNALRGDRVVPADTRDERAVAGEPRSLGVIDDTCDAVVAAELTLGQETLRARANVTVGPPHFAPDRRPFLSLADEINDREHDPGRDAALTATERDRWVEDLFERIAETAWLLDLDFWRSPRPGSYLVATLTGDALTAAPIPGDGVPGPNRALGGRDALRDRDIAIPAPSNLEPFPLSARARERHRALSDLGQLVPWILTHPERLRALVRPPFTTGPTYRASFTMQMPPVMVNSNRWPLTLAHWQYDLLMAWADALTAPSAAAARAPEAEGVSELSDAAAARRRQVLALLDDEQR